MLKRFAFWLTLQWLILATAAYVAHIDHFLTPAEVAHWHDGFGLSAMSHIATWLDALLLAPLMALTVAKFSQSWTEEKIGVCAAIAFLISGYVHFVEYAPDSYKKPTAVFHDGHLTQFGLAHLVFMALVFALVLLFYTASKSGVGYALLFSFALGAHVAAAAIQPGWHLGAAEAFNQHAINIIVRSWMVIALGLWVLAVRSAPRPQR
jgi:hypothetical protein